MHLGISRFPTASYVAAFRGRLKPHEAPREFDGEPVRRSEPNVGAFFEQVIARGKKPIVAVVAVMRKLLHSIYDMLKHNADFDGEKFYGMAAVT